MTLESSRAVVDLQANTRRLQSLLEAHDPEAMRVINLILQDAYVVKDALNRAKAANPEPVERGMVYAHL